MRCTTSGSMRRWSPTSTRWPGRCPAGSGASARSADVAADAAEAVAAALGPPGGVATLILPADVSWSDGAEPAPPGPPRPPSVVPEPVIEEAAGALRGGRDAAQRPAACVILLGGAALRRPGLEAASRIAAATGARLLGETFPARLERGAGLPGLERLAYLAGVRAVTAGRDPAADPGGRERAGVLLRLPGPAQLAGARTAARCTRWPRPGEDVCGALACLAERVAPRDAAAATAGGAARAARRRN